MLDGLRRCRLTGHLNAEGVAEEGVGNPLNLRRHSGGEEEGLACERCEAKDTLDIRDETHVEHAVGFIHNHHFDVSKDQFATLMVIKQTARCGDQNIDAFVDQLVLFLERNTTDQQGLCQLEILGVGVEILSNLCGQLPRGAEH